MLVVTYATGRASHARQVKGDDTDKKGYSGSPGWGLGVGLTIPHSKKFIVTKVEQRNKLDIFNPLNAELNSICYFLALLAHHFIHVSGIRVKSLTLRLLMSHMYGKPILDVSRSHTTMQHSR